VNEAALEAFSFILPIGITLVGVYLAYTGFESVSFISIYVIVLLSALLHTFYAASRIVRVRS